MMKINDLKTWKLFVEDIQDMFLGDKLKQNAFDNELVDISGYHEIVNFIDKYVNSQGYTRIRPKQILRHAYIPYNFADFQWHTRGVLPHEDDFTCFCMITLKLGKEPVANSSYEHFPVLCHGNRLDTHHEMHEGSIVIFDSKKHHSVVHAGQDYLIMLLSVYKLPRSKRANAQNT